WARGPKATHVFTFTLGRRIDRVGNLQVFARLQSGQAYTPVVAGDINGDGYSNDRAFICNPARIADTSISAPMARLLAGAPDNARRCLERQLGSVAGRNSCAGPWSMTNVALVVSPDPYKLRLGNRGSVQLI